MIRSIRAKASSSSLFVRRDPLEKRVRLVLRRALAPVDAFEERAVELGPTTLPRIPRGCTLVDVSDSARHNRLTGAHYNVDNAFESVYARSSLFLFRAEYACIVLEGKGK